MLQYRELKQMGADVFHAPAGTLSFSCESVSLTLHPGQIAEGSFTIYGTSRETITGFVMSSRLCMKVLTPEFSGSKEVISFQFDSTPFSVGDSVDGYFRIISSEGEYRLPFSAKIMPVLVDSTLGPVRNLFHFSNLARSSWKEAVDAFYDPAFPQVFTAAETKELGIYRGLSAHAGNQQNVEEFLIAIGRKQAVEFLPQVTSVEMDLPTVEKEEIPQKLEIQRNGWGYTRLEVLSEGSFLHLQKTFFDASDFGEGSATLLFGIDPASLHAGLNLGKIILRAPFKEQEIPVSVRYCVSTALRTVHHRELGRTICSMMTDYEKLRAHQISGKDFAQRTGTSIRWLIENEHSSPYTALYQIHCLLTAGRTDEAIYELGNLCRKLSGGMENLPKYSIAQYPPEDDTEYAYRLYLTILCADASGDDPIYVSGVTIDAVRQLSEVARRNPDNFWICWLRMYASGDIRKRPADCWMDLRRQFDAGWRSPILYIEVCSLIGANPAILQSFDAFTLSALLYASRHGMLTDAVLTQINYLAVRQKKFDPMLLRILKMGYENSGEEAPKSETLTSICTILIRGNLSDPKYFSWYQKGVAQQLPITRLFDYYMMSMPEDYKGEIPQMVIMYFAYQSTLPYEKNAVLYRYVCEHRKDWPEVFDQYRRQIDDFTEKELLAGHMSRDLAVLYDRYLEGGRALSKDIAEAAVPAVFACLVTVKDPHMHRTVLVYGKCREEHYGPVNRGQCCIPVYDEDVTVFVEDDAGNRYAEDSYFTLEHFMDYKRLAKVLAAYQTQSQGFDLYLSKMTESGYAINKENVYHFQRIADSDDLLPAWRQDVRMKLLHWYSESDSDREMDQFLMSISPEGLGTQARSEILQYMVIRGLNDRALEWLVQYGSFNVDGSTLMRLLSQILYDGQPADDPAFSELVHECFLKGKYDDHLLRYMETYFDGLTEELEEIRTAAVRFGTDDTDLCRRMLVQMLYTGKFTQTREEIVEKYMDSGADSALLSRILAQSAHYSFVLDVPMGRRQYDEIGKYGREGVPIVDICRIAWLHDRAGRQGEISEGEMEVTGLFLEDLLSEGIIFPFFRQFIGVLPALQAYADETLVEYRAKHYVPGVHVIYHYAAEKNGERQKYQTREMKEMYEGVYVTGFLLFFGEQIHYYITDDPEEKNITESGTLGQDARIPDDGDDRFGMINRVCMLTAMGRDEEALARIGNYEHRAFLTDRLFGNGDGDSHAV